jgi:hypothetical protein
MNVKLVVSKWRKSTNYKSPQTAQLHVHLVRKEVNVEVRGLYSWKHWKPRLKVQANIETDIINTTWVMSVDLNRLALY